jgi:hypothetical protein
MITGLGHNVDLAYVQLLGFVAWLSVSRYI